MAKVEYLLLLARICVIMILKMKLIVLWNYWLSWIFIIKQLKGWTDCFVSDLETAVFLVCQNCRKMMQFKITISAIFIHRDYCIKVCSPETPRIPGPSTPFHCTKVVDRVLDTPEDFISSNFYYSCVVVGVFHCV